MGCHEIELPTFLDHRGILSVMEGGQTIPFDIKRVFTITDCQGVRGGHVNPGAYVLQAVQGSCQVKVTDVAGYTLYDEWLSSSYSPHRGVYTPAHTAVHLSLFMPGTIVLVVSDWHYSEAKS